MDDIFATDKFTIHLLGDVGIESSVVNTKLSLPKKGWAILAYLIYESNRSHLRERLAEIFWPELPKKAARNNLRQVVLNIQNLLGRQYPDNSYLITDRSSLQINLSVLDGVDVVSFLHNANECADKCKLTYCDKCVADIEDKVTLYRSEFMADFYLKGCPEFEEWLQINREILHRYVLFMLESLSNYYETLNTPNKAIFFAQRYIELEPWNEQGQRRLIRLLAQNGQQGAALVQYDASCRILKQELNVQPDEKTKLLVRRIQNGDLQLEMSIKYDNNKLNNELSGGIEKRQVTVLSCQFLLSKTTDPDEEFEQLHANHSLCLEIISHFSGHVVWTNDGGLLSYFGFPNACENSSYRAVSVALQLLEVQAANLKLRIGINTGLIITSNNQNAPDIMGNTSGIATNLRDSIPWGTIVVSSNTKRIVSGYFSWVKIKDLELKNKAIESELYQVVKETGIISRLGATPLLTPLVGRQCEVGFLLSQWSKICTKQKPQALLLIGEPGIGKSRLVHCIKQEAVNTSGIIIELHCFSEFSHSPFQPFIGQIKSELRLRTKEKDDVGLKNLVDYMSEFYSQTELEKVIPLFANLLSLPLSPPFMTITTPQKTRREQIMNAILDLIVVQTKTAPVLFVVEDLHWSDPSTLELITMLLSNEMKWPILSVFTARTEFQSSWLKSQIQTLTLEPLANDEISRIVKILALDVESSTIRQIIERASGVPLFAEELAKDIPDIKFKDSLVIPISLQDLLATRLDAMGTVKSIVLLAANLGRKFSIALLRELSLLDEISFKAVIERFNESGLFTRLNDNELQFRHALFQEAVFNSQTRRKRQSIHKRIAEMLEINFPDIVNQQPQIMAQYRSIAGEVEVAIEYWIKAGKLANHHSAYEEAINQLRSGLELLVNISNRKRKYSLEFEIQVLLGVSYYAMEGYASSDGMAAYSRALALGERHGKLGLFQPLWGVWASSSSKADYPKAQEYSERLLSIAKISNDPIELQEGHFAVGNILHWRGEFSKAREHLEQVIKLYKPEHNEQFISRFGENAYVTSCSYLSWILCLQGFPEQAQQISRQAIIEARRIEHPFSLGYALSMAACLAHKLNMPFSVLAIADEAIELSIQYNFPLWRLVATLEKSWASLKMGQKNAIIGIEQSHDSMNAVMSGILLISLTTLIEAQCHLGKYDEALLSISESKNVIAKLGDHHVEAEIYRLEGECQLGRGENALAEFCFNQAIAISRTQGAKLFELRASISQGNMWAAQEKNNAVQQLLTPIYNNLTEGLDYPDMKEAKALLQSIHKP